MLCLKLSIYQFSVAKSFYYCQVVFTYVLQNRFTTLTNTNAIVTASSGLTKGVCIVVMGRYVGGGGLIDISQLIIF